MAKEQTTAFTDSERALIEQVAHERGVTFEEAAAQLASEGLARRVQRKTHRRPAASVRQFRRGKDREA